MATVDLDECFKVAVDLARESGERVHKVLNSKKTYKTKENVVDLVTETDEAIENFIFTSLKEKFPTHRFIGEESSASAGELDELTDEPTWIVDPVDGTMNFVHGFSYVAVSIGMLINKETEIAAVYSVGEQCLYTARKGRGAFRDNVRLSVTETDDISTALVLADTKRCGEGETNVYLENLGNVFKQVHGVRMIGSAVMAGCYVASGCADVYFHFGIHCWDMAAVCLLVTEAGGIMRDPKGSKFDVMSHRMLCTSNEKLSEQISEILIDIPYVSK